MLSVAGELNRQGEMATSDFEGHYSHMSSHPYIELRTRIQTSSARKYFVLLEQNDLSRSFRTPRTIGPISVLLVITPTLR